MGVYHAGSRAVQDRVGVREQADHVGRSVGQGIREVAAAFLELQPLLVAGAADPSTGRVWASPLTGAPGFVRATGPQRISVTGGWSPADPLATAFATPGTPVGTIALDPRTRRRMRLNGTARPSARGLLIEAEQVFANCPKYLQKRELYGSDPAGPGTAAPRTGDALTEAQLAAVRAADTFFVATTGPDGADASHRGGNPGFVHAEGPRELLWRDYPGNAMFLTLGNLETDGRAGLLFLDWESGTTLQLSGRAKTVYHLEERFVRFRVDSVVETPAASPLRWSAPAYSPANPTTP